MMKKIGIFALVISLLLTALSPVLVQALSGLTVLDDSAEVEFPFKLHFKLAAESDTDIVAARLHYRVDRDSYAQVTSEAYIEVIPDKTIDIQWTWDMRRTGGLPPGTLVEYWWTIEDASGDRVETAPVSVQFDDDRYLWQSLTEDKITIYWYEGKRSFIEEIMLAAQQALARLAEDTGAYLKKAVKIYIYADAEDLRGAMIFPQEWTGGVAFTRYGILAIGIAPDDLGWGRRVISHEFTHLVIHQMVFNPYIRLPTWLNEGLAMYTEGVLEPGFAAFLDKAIDEDRLISVASLSSPFSVYAEESFLSYAQSYSLVEFLISSYGRDKMLELLNTFREGSNYDNALQKVYGFDMDGLDALWRDYVTRQFRKAQATARAYELIPV